MEAFSDLKVTCRHLRPSLRSTFTATVVERDTFTVTFAACLHDLRPLHDFGVTFTYLRNERVAFVRADSTTGPETESTPAGEDQVLVVNFLQFVGSGWHTTGDALLANTSAAMAREHQQIARQELAAMTA